GGTSSATQGNVVAAFGQGNAAINIGGTGNFIEAGDLINVLGTKNPTPSTLTAAFGLGGSNNQVVAAPGPLNVAGEINHTGTTGTLTALNTIKFG
ncbi:MAG: hypothetical protein JO280_14645, partial [Mycobacteriaceae bacterium]|nr:hypothetical protein [Mycobacteriaceae bacterium]